MRVLFKNLYNRFEIEKGNKIYNGLLVLFCVVTYILCLKLKGQTIEQCYEMLIWMNAVMLVILIPYRILLVFDKEYMEYCYPNTKKSFLFELPFFSCNTAEILFIFALCFKSRALLAYCFFMGFIGPILALIEPAPGFEKNSLLHFRMFGFYFVHYLCLMNIPLLLVSRIFIPTIYDVFTSIGLYTLFSFLAFLINIWINHMHLGSQANYFFNTDPNYHPLFRKIYKIIPIPFLFTIPLELFIGIVFCLLVYLIQFVMR